MYTYWEWSLHTYQEVILHVFHLSMFLLMIYKSEDKYQSENQHFCIQKRVFFILTLATIQRKLGHLLEKP